MYFSATSIIVYVSWLSRTDYSRTYKDFLKMFTQLTVYAA